MAPSRSRVIRSLIASSPMARQSRPKSLIYANPIKGQRNQSDIRIIPLLQFADSKDMLALSIRQPYAELIMRGIKRIEYRSRPTRIIGERFYIYASKKSAVGGEQWAGKAGKA